jgi:hypothetical protein
VFVVCRGGERLTGKVYRENVHDVACAIVENVAVRHRRTAVSFGRQAEPDGTKRLDRAFDATRLSCDDNV